MKHNIEWLIELRKNGTLKYWATYLRILKHCKGSGYLPKSGTRSLGKYSTFMNHLNKMIKLGWAWKTRNGYRLTSYKVLGPIIIQGNTVNELLARCCACAWDQSIIKQLYKTGKKRLVKKRNGSAQSVSVRWFSNLMGYASASSGSKLEKLMEENKLVKIKRNSRTLFNVNDSDGWTILKHSGFNNRFFISGEWVKERTLNTLTLL